METASDSKKEYREIIEKIAEEAARQLREMAHPSAARRGRNLVKRALHRPGASGDRIFWPAGLLMLGLTEAGHTAEVEEYLEPWIRRGMPVQNPDDAVAGAVLLRLYETTGKECYHRAAEKILDYLDHCRRDAKGAIVYGQHSSNSWIYADGAGQTAMLYAAAGRTEDALHQLNLYARYGTDESTGLPYHGYDESSGLCLGIIGWGRAAGWLMLGIAECASGAAGEVLERFLGALYERRRRDGLFSWQLDCRKGPLDTSAGGMIYYALQRMMQGEISQKAAGPFAQSDLDAAAKALLEQTDAAGRVLQSSAECIDFAQYVQQYGTYPWGQGAVLAFLAAWQRSGE